MPPKKDPLKPKGRTSAYAFFVQEKKEYNKANGINLDFTGFSQCCSEDWKKLSQEKKKKYFDLAEVDKARYDREMKEYVPPTEEGKRRKKKQKDKNAPKRGMYVYYTYGYSHFILKIKRLHLIVMHFFFPFLLLLILISFTGLVSCSFPKRSVQKS